MSNFGRYISEEKNSEISKTQIFGFFDIFDKFRKFRNLLKISVNFGFYRIILSLNVSYDYL